MRLCPHCGGELLPRASFCHKCGRSPQVAPSPRSRPAPSRFATFYHGCVIVAAIFLGAPIAVTLTYDVLNGNFLRVLLEVAGLFVLGVAGLFSVWRVYIGPKRG